MPEVIKRLRTKGWKMPTNTVYVGRPSRWQNPFKTIDSYRVWLTTGEVRCHDIAGYPPKFEWEWWRSRILINAKFLRGFNLACWCIDWNGLATPPDVCHAEILLGMANRP